MSSNKASKIDSINASNITTESLKSHFGEDISDIEVPTVKEVREKVIETFDNKYYSQLMEGTDKTSLEKNRDRFIKLTETPPPGFSFQVIATQEVDRNDRKLMEEHKKKRRSVRGQYKRNTHGYFISYLANKFPKYLESKGVSKYIVRLMKHGYLNITLLTANIDHILELGMEGKFSREEQSPDPQNPYSNNPVYDANKFENLTLISEKIHVVKNQIHELQKIIAPINTPFYMITLAPNPPKNTAENFISIPTTKRKKYGTNKLSDSAVIKTFIYKCKKIKPTNTKYVINRHNEMLSCINEYISEKFNKAVMKDISEDKLNTLNKFFEKTNIVEISNNLKKNKALTINRNTVINLNKSVKAAKRQLNKANRRKGSDTLTSMFNDTTNKIKYRASNIAKTLKKMFQGPKI